MLQNESVDKDFDKKCTFYTFFMDSDDIDRFSKTYFFVEPLQRGGESKHFIN
jgi:hypothetical protein